MTTEFWTVTEERIGKRSHKKINTYYYDHHTDALEHFNDVLPDEAEVINVGDSINQGKHESIIHVSREGLRIIVEFEDKSRISIAPRITNDEYDPEQKEER